MPTPDTNLINEIEKIKERNRRVETDKAWESSNTRRMIITISIYLLATLVFLSIRAPDPFMNAVIPACAFLFSTATLPLLRDLWSRWIYRKKDR